MPQKAFVTGGTGFIGINLVKLLVDKDWSVTALHRASSDLTYLKKLPVNLVEGSITDPASLRQVIPEDTGVVFHLAGDTNLWSPMNERQTKINVQGTENMVLAAAQKGISTFIHTSSGAAWGDQSGLITEQTPQLGGASWVNYEKTKWAGERKALRGLDHGMKVVILNPTSVMGPHDDSNWGRLFFALRDDALPGIPNGSISIGHVHHVAEAHHAAVEKGRPGERYILAGVNCGFAELIKAIASASGISSLPRIIPAPLFKIYARIFAAAALVTGNEPDVTPELAKLMTRKGVSFSSEKAKRELDYKIPPIRQSVNDCYNWLKKKNLL